VAPPAAPDGIVDAADVEAILGLVLAGDVPGAETLLRGDLAPASLAGDPADHPLRLAPNPVPAWPLDVGDAVLVARRAAGDVLFVGRNAARS